MLLRARFFSSTEISVLSSSALSILRETERSSSMRRHVAAENRAIASVGRGIRFYRFGEGTADLKGGAEIQHRGRRTRVFIFRPQWECI